MDSDDPFNAAQRDILDLLSSTRPLLESYLRIRRTTSSFDSPELQESRRDLEQNLSDLSADLQDLIDSVRAVEGDPYKYGLEVAEVARRRQLVEDVGSEVEGMRAQVLETVDAKTPKGPSSHGAGQPGLPHPDAFVEDEVNEDNDAYEEFEQQRQQEMLRDQDEALDGVFRTVGSLRQQADDMGRELEEQGILLDDVDNLADRVGGKLQNGIKKIGWVVRNNEDTWSTCCIGILIFVLILLLVLLLIL